MQRPFHVPSTLRTVLASGLVGLIGLSVLTAGMAQERFPSKPITIVVPYPPGGSNDVFARVIAREMADHFKQPVLVDNRPGASGTTGTAAVARAPADGYTLVAVSSSMTTNAALQTRLAFDPVKDLAPVAMLAQGPFIVAVHQDLPVHNPTQLIQHIRRHPGQFNYASSGTGSVNQFGTELLKAQAGTLFITHIPYRGMGPAVTDLISGHVQVLMASGPSLLPMVQAGRVRAIGITSLKPSAVAPELTPMATAVPGYEYSLWWGLLAPAGTPAATLQQLNAAVNQALAKPAIKQQFLTEGAEVQVASPAQFGQVIARDIERWKTLARQQHIVAD